MKNPLKDPFFFVKLDHIDSYKPSKCLVNQGGAHLVLVCNFFSSNFDFVFFRFFLLYCPNLFPIELYCLFLVQIRFISSLKGVEGVGACFLYLIRSHSQQYVSLCLSGFVIYATLP